MAEAQLECTSFPGGKTIFTKAHPVLLKYFDTGSQKWERWSGSGGQPYVSLSGGVANLHITGSDIPLGVTGSVQITASPAISGSVNVSGSIQITGSTVTIPVYDSNVLSSICSAPSGSSVTQIDFLYSGSYITGSIYSGSSSQLFALTFTYDNSGSLTRIVRT